CSHRTDLRARAVSRNAEDALAALSNCQVARHPAARSEMTESPVWFEDAPLALTEEIGPFRRPKLRVAPSLDSTWRLRLGQYILGARKLARTMNCRTATFTFTAAVCISVSTQAGTSVKTLDI